GDGVGLDDQGRSPIGKGHDPSGLIPWRKGRALATAAFFAARALDLSAGVAAAAWVVSVAALLAADLAAFLAAAVLAAAFFTAALAAAFFATRLRVALAAFLADVMLVSPSVRRHGSICHM